MSTDDDPFVQITNREVWDALRAHERASGEGGHADHERRIRSLELRYYAVLAGLAAGVVAATGVAIQVGP